MNSFKGGRIIVHLKNYLGKISSRYTFDELVIIYLVLSIFISIYVTGAFMLFLLIYLIKNNRLKTVLASVSGSYSIIAFCLISFIVSLSFKNWIGMLIAIAMCAIFIISMYIRTMMTRKLFETILDLSCLLSFVAFIVAVVEQLVMSGDDKFRASSTFLNANYYATMIEFIVIVAVYKLIHQTTAKQKLFYTLTIIVNIVGLYLCDCRTAFIVIACCVAIILLLNRKYKPFALFALSGLLIIAIFSIYPNILPRAYLVDASLTTRVSIWKTSIRAILQNPLFGEGGSTYLRIYTQFGGHQALHAHNLFLDPLLNFGIVGVSLLAIYLIENLRPILRMHNTLHDKKRFYLLVTIVLAVLLHGITDITVFDTQVGLFLAVFLSVAGITESETALSPSRYLSGNKRMVR